ncbi:Uncharacterised protein [Klebsiella pneumoniae]|nr:Uncharacterised protein [Klebsiella pneumoniae]
MLLFLFSHLGLFSVAHFLQFLSFAFVHFDLIVIQRFIVLVFVIEIGVVHWLKNFLIRQDYCRCLILQLPLPIFTDELVQCIGGKLQVARNQPSTEVKRSQGAVCDFYRWVLLHQLLHGLMNTNPGVAPGKIWHHAIQLLQRCQAGILLADIWSPCSGEVSQFKLLIVQLGVFIVMAENFHEEYILIDILPPRVNAEEHFIGNTGVNSAAIFINAAVIA